MAQAWIHNRKYISSIMKQKHKDLLDKHSIGIISSFSSFTLALMQILKNKFARSIKGVINKEKSVKVEGLLNLSEVIKQYGKDYKK